MCAFLFGVLGFKVLGYISAVAASGERAHGQVRVKATGSK
jgi:hypothetical protein